MRCENRHPESLLGRLTRKERAHAKKMCIPGHTTSQYAAVYKSCTPFSAIAIDVITDLIIALTII
jgi:hypothetical protein